MLDYIDFKYVLQEDGFYECKNQFKKEAIKNLNSELSVLPPFVGNAHKVGWLNDTAVKDLSKTHDLLKDIDWICNWSKTPTDNDFINKVILPKLVYISDKVFGYNNWGWQESNKYVVSNYPNAYSKNELDENFLFPHMDAPYLWPQKLDVDIAKVLKPGPLSLTFIVPLIKFTKENGATSYVKGSNKFHWNTLHWNSAQSFLKQFLIDNSTQPEIDIGNFVCFSGNLIHSVTSNPSSDIRRGIIYRSIRNDALEEMKKHNFN